MQMRCLIVGGIVMQGERCERKEKGGLTNEKMYTFFEQDIEKRVSAT